MSDLIHKKTEQKLFSSIKKPLKLVVYISGGSDSVALLHYLVSIKSKYQLIIKAQHFNFMLRGQESDQDEAFVKNLCKKMDVPCTVDHPDKKFETETNKSPQEWARNLRLNRAEQWQNDGFVVATGHHRDDLAENFLMRLTRGASPEKILGMQIQQGKFLKPFLEVTKKQLIDYIEDNGLVYRTDPSNSQTKYFRNKVRHQILPVLEEAYPKASKRIVEFGSHCEAVFEYANQQLMDEFELKETHLKKNLIKNLSESMTLHIIHLFIKIHTNISLERATIADLYGKFIGSEDLKQQISDLYFICIETRSDGSILFAVKKSTNS